jgi:hypothetical protein
MDWNIIFFEIALVSLLIPIAIGLFVVLTGIKATLKSMTDGIKTMNKMLDSAVIRDNNLHHRIDMLEIRLGFKNQQNEGDIE